MTPRQAAHRICRAVLAAITFAVASVTSFAAGFFGVLLIVDYLPHTLT